MSRSDPIRTRYYDAVECADKLSSLLFYIAAILSIIVLLVDRKAHQIIYDAMLIFFVVVVVAVFATDLASRFYFMPRAEDKRRQDFFSSAYGVSLTHEKTEGYYNNDLTEPIKRMTAQVLENSHFSKAIALRMAQFERAKVIIYVIIWLVCLLIRKTDFGIILVASQAVFSEQIASRWFRLEWLRRRFEKTYDDVYRLFQSNPIKSKFNAMALESLSMYETSKVNGAITLSSAVFDKMNPELSHEWDKIKAELNI